jgi:hypothetical protein
MTSNQFIKKLLEKGLLDDEIVSMIISGSAEDEVPPMKEQDPKKAISWAKLRLSKYRKALDPNYKENRKKQIEDKLEVKGLDWQKKE